MSTLKTKPFQAAVAEPFLKRRSEAILVETKAVELCSISLVYTNCTGGKKHRCVEQYRLADEARRYAKPFQAAVMNEAQAK